MIRILIGLGLLLGGWALSDVAEDYRRADRVGYSALKDAIYAYPTTPVWLGSGKRFWYSTRTRTGKAYYLVDAEKGKKQLAFDHAKIAAELQAGNVRDTVDEQNLPLGELIFTGDNLTGATIDQKKWLRDIKKGGWRLAAVEPSGKEVSKGRFVSPDGTHQAFRRDGNVWLREVSTKQERQITHDGSSVNGFQYAVGHPAPGESPTSAFSWSPDSKWLQTVRFYSGNGPMTAFATSADTEGKPSPVVLSRFVYPGDPDPPRSEIVFIHAETGRVWKPDLPPSLFLYYGSPMMVTWQADGSRCWFLNWSRGISEMRVHEILPSEKRATVWMHETSKTSINLTLHRWHVLDKIPGILFTSEASGWRHLMISRKPGEAAALTRGNWLVRDILRVDEDAERIWFSAMGREPGDPYLIRCYSVGFDGSDLQLITPEDGTHELHFSPNGDYAVHIWSGLNVVPQSVVRDMKTGEVICRLQVADDADWRRLGVRRPELFIAKGRDDKTDVYGVIFRPTNLDKQKKYPIIEQIYGGPHGFFTPRKFWASYYRGQALAELGFLVVMLDGMGTDGRSVAFREGAWKNLADGGFPDRKAWIRAVAKRYSYADLSRVGIYGHSAGGYNAAHGMLAHGDFYHVGVASAGNHDQRLDKGWWPEQWMGYPIGPQYAAQSNTAWAHKLKGKLLLAHGERDTNVPLTNCLQMVAALTKANKPYDLLIVPGAGHGIDADPYFLRRRSDYFIEHLQGRVP